VLRNLTLNFEEPIIRMGSFYRRFSLQEFFLLNLP